MPLKTGKLYLSSIKVASDDGDLFEINDIVLEISK